MKVAVDTRDPLHGFWIDNHEGNFPFYSYDSKKVVDEFYITIIRENQTWTEVLYILYVVHGLFIDMYGFCRQTRHTFENYGPGVRYVLFQSYGRCRQYSIGPKMANASLHLSLDLERQRKQ